jgi:hypothetical protein
MESGTCWHDVFRNRSQLRYIGQNKATGTAYFILATRPWVGNFWNCRAS